MGQCGPFTLAARSPQAIQSRDRIQLQYSQSLIEKDQYRKQVRGLEAERDELLTALTSLEGAKALLEAQLQRVQGGPCLKVSGVRGTGVLVGMLRSRQELLAGVGSMQDLVGDISPGGGTPQDAVGTLGWAREDAGSGRKYVGPGWSPPPGSRTCWSGRELLGRTENTQGWWSFPLGWVWLVHRDGKGARVSPSLWGCSWGTRNSEVCFCIHLEKPGRMRA